MGGRHSQFQPGHRESFWDGHCERNTNGNGGGLNHNEYRGRTASECDAGVWPSAVCSAWLCRLPTATYPAARLRSGAVRGPFTGCGGGGSSSSANGLKAGTYPFYITATSGQNVLVLQGMLTVQ
jgi:hypothetical protein